MSAIKLASGKLVELKPTAVLRCPTALMIARWVREDLAPLAERLGSRIERIDVRALHLADGRKIAIENADGPPEFLAGMRQSACARFMTVLGPGSDKDHESHLHVDLAERRGGYKMCQWVLPEPAKAPETAATDAEAAGKKAEKEK